MLLKKWMRQIYFIISLIVAFIIEITTINSGITFAQEKNETSEIKKEMNQWKQIILYLKWLIIHF